MKVLIAAPVYEGTDHSLLDFVNACRANNPDRILLIDNSKSKKHFRQVRKSFPDVDIIYNSFSTSNPMEKVASSRNLILDYAKQNDFDYLFMLDADVILPKLAYLKLVRQRKDIISGIYFNRLRDLNDATSLVPPAWIGINKTQFNLYKKIGKIPKDMPYDPLIKRYLSHKELMSKKIFEVILPCGGCCLMSKKAFTSGARYSVIKGSSDEIVYFRELIYRGFKLYVDTSLLCEHRK